MPISFALFNQRNLVDPGSHDHQLFHIPSLYLSGSPLLFFSSAPDCLRFCPLFESRFIQQLSVFPCSCAASSSSFTSFSVCDPFLPLFQAFLRERFFFRTLFMDTAHTNCGLLLIPRKDPPNILSDHAHKQQNDTGEKADRRHHRWPAKLRQPAAPAYESRLHDRPNQPDRGKYKSRSTVASCSGTIEKPMMFDHSFSKLLSVYSWKYRPPAQNDRIGTEQMFRVVRRNSPCRCV